MIKVTTDNPYSIPEIVTMCNSRGLYDSDIGLVRIITASPGQEIDVDFTLYETTKKRFWGVKLVKGKSYHGLVYRIKEM